MGANLLDARANLKNAIEHLSERISKVKLSSLYITKARDYENQPHFHNCVVLGSWEGSAFDLLNFCQKIENELGRTREIEKGPRIIDIDILLFGTSLVDTEVLIIPHPRLSSRRFALAPLIELWPDALEPKTNIFYKDYLSSTLDQIIYEQFPLLYTKNYEWHQ